MRLDRLGRLRPSVREHPNPATGRSVGLVRPARVPPGGRRRGPGRATLVLVAAAAAALLVAACGGDYAQPQPTPADFAGIVAQLAKVRIVVSDVVAGDAGCPDPTLTKTAIAFTASGLDQAGPVRLRVYIFGSRDAWQRLAGTVATCARSYVTDPATYESLAPSPFIVSGQGPWAERFRAALLAAFTVAAGSGG